MKPVRLSLFTLSLLCVALSYGNSPVFKQIEKDFADPAKEYRSAPLWVWNTKVTTGDIDRMLAELKEAGFGGAFVHPRPGLITEYLSDEWFDLYRHSVDKGRELGLDIWIYDENSYPSGFAGGHVPAQMPESYNQGQGLVSEKASMLPADLKEYPCILRKEGAGFVDITRDAAQYAGREGDYYLYKKTYYGRSSWHGGYSYVDLLYPGVTEKFIDITMSGYEKTFGSELGPVVKGIFTDEPNIASAGGIRWTPDLFEVFRQKWGYELTTVLPSLFEEVGDWKRVRHNYTETLLQLFIDRWSKPWYEYTESKGLVWTGHYWEHGWPDMGHGGDNMAMYAWHQMPAIDMLFNQFNDENPQAQFGNVRAVKELRSVANQMGFKRTLSETYGGGGWELTFEDMKRLGDWEYVLGVNFLNQHLSHMTLEGSRKYDYPPVFTYHSPWWPQYRYLNDYFARLSMLLSNGEQVNDILVIEPTSTIWMYYSYAGSSEQLWPTGCAFQSFVTKLEKAQVEYDLGSENIIKDQGAVNGKGFTVGKRTYGKVVLPPFTDNINSPTFALLKDFVANGGDLLAFSSPTRVDGRESPELVEFMKSHSNIRHIPELTDAVAFELSAGSGCTFSETTGSGLYHQRRRYGDGELIFVVNSSLEENAAGKISVRGGWVLELDALSAEIYRYPAVAANGKVTMEFALPPAGSLMLFVSGADAYKDYSYKSVKPMTNVVGASSQVRVETLSDNALFIDFCDLEVNGSKYSGLHFADAATKYFNAAGFAGDPWTTAIQYKQAIAERDTITTGSAVATYRFTVGDGVDLSKLKLVTERPGLWSVSVNGEKVTNKDGEWWLDKHFGVYNIGKAARRGENTVEMSVAPLSIYAEIEPVYIVGDFTLAASDTGWTIEKPNGELALGSWKEQGLPFYSWDMAYTKEYKIKDTSRRYALRLNEWNGTVARVNVNGRPAGTIAFQPGELDITRYLKKGRNRIEVVITGSLKNLLGPHHNNPGGGIAGPWHWKNIFGPVAGDGYQLLDYGLAEDFDLVSSN